MTNILCIRATYISGSNICLIFRQGVGEHVKLLTDPSIVSNACPCQTFDFLLEEVVPCTGDLFKLLFGNHRQTQNSSPATCCTSFRILKMKITPYFYLFVCVLRVVNKPNMRIKILTSIHSHLKILPPSPRDRTSFYDLSVKLDCLAHDL